MSPLATRRWLRWSHIAAGLIIGAYVCSPLHADPTATLAARLSLLPVLGLTGLAMWQQGRLSRLLRQGRSDASPSDGRRHQPLGRS